MPDDLPQLLLDQIAHFVQHYKDLAANKRVKVQSWIDAEEFKAEIVAGVERLAPAPE